MRRFILASLFVLGCSSSDSTSDETVTDSGTTTVDTSTTSDSSTTTDSSTTETSESDSTAADTAMSTDTTMSTDTATSMDTAIADTAKPDTAKPPTDGGTCSNNTDCKLFSSYCMSAACVCIPLLKTESPPKCETGMVSCFVDPCASKTAACEGGKCVAK